MSEDFDLALRLLLKGYTLRWATYSNGGFKEGVSLTVVDELARWQKYAYGGFFSNFRLFGILRNSPPPPPPFKVAMRLFSTRSSIGGDVDLSVNS